MHFGHRIVQCTSNQVYRICIRLSNGIESDLYRNCVKFAIKTTPPFDNMTLGKSFHLWWINRKNPLINHNPLPPRLIKTSNPGLIKKSRLVKKNFIDERSQRYHNRLLIFMCEDGVSFKPKNTYLKLDSQRPTIYQINGNFMRILMNFSNLT